jgi:RimJ/RimL family protein N-acetyltransferase
MTYELKLRVATWNDTALTLAWRNDVETRMSRADYRFVSLDEHMAWTIGHLAEDALWIAELCGRPCGQIVLDQGGEIGWIVAPELRHASIGHHMLKIALAKFPDRLRCRVSQFNTVSRALARSCGFHETSVIANGMILMERSQEGVSDD